MFGNGYSVKNTIRTAYENKLVITTRSYSTGVFAAPKGVHDRPSDTFDLTDIDFYFYFDREGNRPNFVYLKCIQTKQRVDSLDGCEI